MDTPFDLRKPFTASGLVLSIATVLLIVWLAVSINPSHQRSEKLNELIHQGKIGHTNPRLQERLELQFTWLARHAGATSRIAINKEIDSRQLTLLVTTPQYSDVTHCGTGNAIYDPSLNTIFVDESLLWPTEVNIIGTPSVNTMFTIDNYGYIVSYTNFILAHELGHWRKRDKGAAFFYYGWGDGTASIAEEETADRSAVKTIVAAREAGDEPLSLKKLDTLSVIGLGNTPLAARESAAGDLLGGMLLMTDDLLFSSSPFSPYYSNATHPNMLQRVDDAIRTIELAPPGTLLKAETGLVQAELKHLAALGTWKHREIFFPGPLTRAEVRAGSLWLGRTDIPTTATVKLQEQIYKLPLSALISKFEQGDDLALESPIKTGYSKVGEVYSYAEGFGQWVNDVFERGDGTVGLPPDATPVDPHSEKDWGRSRWGGLESLGLAWRWPARGDTSAGRITERQLLAILKQQIPATTVELGAIQWLNDALVVPVIVTGPNNATEMRLFQLLGPEPFHVIERKEFRFSTSGNIDVSSAKLWKENLWVPVRKGMVGSNYRVELWCVRPGQPQLFDTASFLAGQDSANLDKESLQRLFPENPKFLPISSGRAVFGYDHDSLYLVDERVGHLQVLFHPAAAGLQLTDLGSGFIMFWKLHARKAYVVSTDPMR